MALSAVSLLLASAGSMFRGLATSPGWSLGRLALLALFLANWKSLPFAWHVRTTAAMLRAIAKRRRRDLDYRRPGADARTLAAADFFREYEMRFRATPGDCDWNMHVNNGVYNVTADFSRADLIIQSGLGLYIRNSGCRVFNGGVAFVYLREIPFMSAFWVRSKFVTWDRKWLVLEHRFENKDGTVVYAMGHSRIVLKERSRKTIPPADALRAMGLAEEYLSPVHSIPACCQAVLEAERALELHSEEDMIQKGADKDATVGKEEYLAES